MELSQKIKTSMETTLVTTVINETYNAKINEDTSIFTTKISMIHLFSFSVIKKD